MNQQAGPSIILSVLIVGFFAVALFPREPARARKPAGHDQSAGPVGSRNQPDGPSPARSEPIAGLAPAAAGKPVLKAAAVQDDATSLVAVRSTSRIPGDARPMLRKTSKPAASPVPPPGRPLRTIATLSERPQIPHQPSQAATLVGADETIADVALRVYGTTSQAEALWRANRDALPRRDSPLVPGTLLRTPTVR
jgi:hypothetical protein